MKSPHIDKSIEHCFKCFKKHMAAHSQESLSKRQSKQSTGYVNPLRNFHSSSVLLCLCVYRKRATAEEGLNHPWLNSHPHPHPNPHLHSIKASSLDEPETSQSESEPESPACSPDLDLIGSYLLYPGQGDLKTGRHAFSFSEPPFAPRPEIQQELICWEAFHRRGDAALTPRSLQLISFDRARGPCFRAAVLLYSPWAGLCAFDTSVCFYMPICADLWLLGWNEKQEKGQGKEAAAAAASALHRCLMDEAHLGCFTHVWTLLSST